MLGEIIGFILAFGIGFSCKKFDIPCPCPPTLYGAALVVSITLGYLVTSWIFF